MEPRGGRASQPGRPAAPLRRAARPAPYCPSHPDRVPFRGGPRRLRASGEAFPALRSPRGRSCGGRLPEKQSWGVRVSGREPWSPRRRLHPSSPPAWLRGSRRGPAVSAVLLARSPSPPGPRPPAPARRRIPESAPRRRLVGRSCGVGAAGPVKVLRQGWRSRPTGSREGPRVEGSLRSVSRLSEPRGVRSALPLPGRWERRVRRGCAHVPGTQAVAQGKGLGGEKVSSLGMFLYLAGWLGSLGATVGGGWPNFCRVFLNSQLELAG